MEDFMDLTQYLYRPLSATSESTNIIAESAVDPLTSTSSTAITVDPICVYAVPSPAVCVLSSITSAGTMSEPLLQPPPSSEVIDLLPPSIICPTNCQTTNTDPLEIPTELQPLLCNIETAPHTPSHFTKAEQLSPISGQCSSISSTSSNDSCHIIIDICKSKELPSIKTDDSNAPTTVFQLDSDQSICVAKPETEKNIFDTVFSIDEKFSSFDEFNGKNSVPVELSEIHVDPIDTDDHPSNNNDLNTNHNNRPKRAHFKKSYSPKEEDSNDSDEEYLPSTSSSIRKRRKINLKKRNSRKSSSISNEEMYTEYIAPQTPFSYRHLRDKNNESSRKSRKKRRDLEQNLEREEQELSMMNMRLKLRVNHLQELVDRFRTIFFTMLSKK